MTGRQQALDALRTADRHAGETQVGDHAAAMALIGIGYAVLDVADAIRGLGSGDIDALIEATKEPRP